MTTQVWRCPRCGHEYLSPMKVQAVACHTGHPDQSMQLVDTPVPTKKKESAK